LERHTSFDFSINGVGMHAYDMSGRRALLSL
jgi:hypothetical protein